MSDAEPREPDSVPQEPDSITIRRGPYPEFTWTAVFVGWAIGALIAVSIGYAALILGFAIEGSELAAILGWGVLRGVMRRTSIVENNINQTIASAVNGASSGIMFSVPALFILSRNEGFESVADFNVPLMILACITGCVLGLAFVIPLRKQMIDFDRLAYPGGIAVATILKSPGAGVRKAILLLSGALISGLAHLLVLTYLGDDADWAAGEQFSMPAMLNISFYLSVMTIGVGFLSGKGGFWFGAGGFLCYFVLSPLLYRFAGPEVAGMVSDPSQMRGVLYRPLGIGMLVGAAVGGIIAAFPLIVSAMKSMHSASKQQDSGKSALNDEMPIGFLYGAIGIGALVMVWIAFYSVDSMTIGRAVSMAVLGTLWVWVAGVVVAECIGRTNWSPLSGMTLIAVTILILVAKGGLDDAATITSCMLVGAAICLAISQASDMMLDLKSALISQEDFEEAYTKMNECLEIDTAFAPAYLQRGRIWIQWGALEDASEDLDRAIGLDPGLGEAYFYKGYILYGTDTTGEDARLFNEAISRGYTHSWAYYFRGLTKIREGRDGMAMNDFNRAIEGKVDFALAYHERGGVKRRTGDLQGAHFDYQTAIEYQPVFPLAYNNRGSVKILLGDYEGAIADYTMALEQDPQLVMALNNRGYARNFLGDLEGALQDFDAAITLNTQFPIARLNKASLFAKQQQIAPALDLLDGVLVEYPNEAVLYLNRGLIRELSGDINGACEDWNMARELGAKEADEYIKECSNL